jgi:integrase
MTDPRIRLDRRVFHTLQGLTGTRVGEVACIRWRDYDCRAKPLGALHVHCQYDGQPLKTASGADTKARIVPVYPELARVLSEWRSRGFRSVYGRRPSEEDFIVPDPRNMRARTPSQVTKAPDQDCEAVRIEDKGTHGFRRYFITYARADGASPDVLERFTHNRRGEIIDVYTSFEWPTLCDAVRCLDVSLRDVEMGLARDRVLDTFWTPKADPARKLNGFNPKLVEAVGIEQPGAHPSSTILEWFRGQVSTRTRPKNTSKTR